ncbi:hypothetical protein Hanom_Chr10g00961911 [Helianthus anomalus]
MLSGQLKKNISWMKVFPFATYLDPEELIRADVVLVEEVDLIQSKVWVCALYCVAFDGNMDDTTNLQFHGYLWCSCYLDEYFLTQFLLV